MALRFLVDWLSDKQIQGICWTLVHSLWIGLIVSVLASLVMALTTRSSAALRYRLFCSLLMLFVFSVAIAGVYELENFGRPILIRTVHPKIQTVNLNGIPAAAMTEIAFYARASAFLNQYSSWILAIWMFFLVIKSIRLTIGLLYIQRIRTYNVQHVGNDWIAKVYSFSEQMGIKQQINVIQSALVKVPVTFGYFKPVIVLPIGLLVSLPVSQVETILWHELAHIYRRDYLVNILQKIVEVFFFFNPAALWLSALIREEREACCDDIVLARVEQKTCYLEALMSFYGQQNRAAGLAIALSLRPNQLMNRLRRMVDQRNRRLSFVEFILMVVGFVVLSAFTFIPQMDKEIKKSTVYIKDAITRTLAPRTVKFGQKADTARKFHRVIEQVVKAKKDSLPSDTLVSVKSIRFNRDNRDKANRDMTVVDGKDNRYHIVVAGGKITAVEVNGQAVVVSKVKNYETLVSQIDSVIDRKRLRLSVQYDNGYRGHQIKRMDAEPGERQVKTIGPIGTQVFKVAFKPSANKKNEIETQLPTPKIPPIDASADKARVLGVISALVEQKIVPGIAQVEWFALTDEQLVTNGKKQEASLHRKLKEKYNIGPDNGLFFGPTKVHGTGIVFDKEDL
ncbi:MAG: M56 family metallopeptidase [Dyadobacter sp.]|uniref:M56 family metallopeptidase n=1 Tax=Dyadobacter sp. TaxID=1914288 RepID=UPI001B14D882|nr:M56 family metallopeptidase [Dyadobacter sp.]MBO9611823.1 M56 family metallopeptidase [Dyadobacter sp.]